MIPTWTLVPVFLSGLLLGAVLCGMLIGHLGSVLVAGLGVELSADLERRFKMDLINREFESVVEPVTDELDKELAHAPKL